MIPYIIVAPYYFAGQITLGVMTQTAGAFARVEGALTFFITRYQALAELQGRRRPPHHVRRRHRRARRARQRAAAHRARAAPTAGDVVHARSHAARCPTGGSIVGATNLSCRPGRGDPRHRAVGFGQVDAVPRHRRHLALSARAASRRPARRSVMLLPQRPYIPHRHAARRGDLSRGRRRLRRRADRARRSRRRGCRNSRPARRGRQLGAAAVAAASSSASRSPARCSPSPTGCSSTRRPRRSTRSWKAEIYRDAARAAARTRRSSPSATARRSSAIHDAAHRHAAGRRWNFRAPPHGGRVGGQR